MSERRRRQFYLSPEFYGEKYVKRPKRKPINDRHSSLTSINNLELLENHHDTIPEPDELVVENVSLDQENDSSESDLSDYESPEVESNGTEEERSNDEEEDEVFDGPENIPKLFSVVNKNLFTTKSDLAVDDVLLMVLNYYVRHGITQAAVEDMLRMFNTISGTKLLPENFSTFIAHFQTNPYNSSRIFYCSGCQFDYGSIAPEKNAACPICECKNKDFFISIPVEPQIRELVTEHKSKIEEYERFVEDNEIADVMRGRYAQKVLLEDPRPCLTLSANTDGAATFRCSTQKPLYPIFVTLNNLPPYLRFSKHNLILGGIWLSKGEPNTNLLFKYLCIELRRLKQDGLIIGSITYSVALLQVNLDSVARCKVQNLKQFNGTYGCTYCLHPGEKKPTNNSRCYPFLENVLQREDAQTRRLMETVSTTGTEDFGVMGKTVFTFLPDFDVVQCFPPDYMHCILLGVIKQIWSLWTDSENHKQQFYVGDRLGEIEQRMLAIRPPSAFPRYPRQLRESKKFKANEWEPILLYYLYPVLIHILPRQYIEHIMLLSSSVFQLLDPKLNETVICACETNLKEFLKKFQQLYGKQNMSYNIHLLGHLIEAVRNFGALYNFSLFPYEAGNGLLQGFRTGNKKPLLQIERKYYMHRFCKYPNNDANSRVKTWVNTVWSHQQTVAQFDPKMLYIINENLVFEEDVMERLFSTHSKTYINGLNLCTSKYCENFQYNDSCIHMNGKFYNIIEILCDRNNTTYIVGQNLVCQKLFTNLYTYKITNVFKVIKINNSIQQCINMSMKLNDNSLNYLSLCKIRTQVD